MRGMSEKFRAMYHAQDGYVGKDRPQQFNIDASELEDDMDDEALRRFYTGACDAHFEENVTAGPERVEEFVKWGREQLAKRGGGTRPPSKDR